MRTRISRAMPWKDIAVNQAHWGRFNPRLFSRAMSTNHPGATPGLLREHSAAEGIRDYVKKNSELPAFYRNIAEHPEQHREYLEYIIQTLNDNSFSRKSFDKIVQNPDCLSYLLYLIENKKIPYWHGISLYQYAMAAAQFSETLPLNPRDNDVKSIRKFSLKPMVTNGRLNKTGEKYLQRTVRLLNDKYGVALDIAELEEFIIHSPQIEQHLLKVECSLSDRYEDPIEDMIVVLKMNIPLFQDDSVGYCSLPPTTLMNFIFSKMSAQPVHARPILGNVNELTRDEMHYANEHPVALYSNAIKSNIHTVHRRRCGAFPTMMHDWAHIFWANVIAPEDRNMLMHRMIPALRKTQQQHPSSKIATAIERICRGLMDFDLSGSFHYEDERLRLHNYVMRVIGDELANSTTSTSHQDDDVIINCLKEFIADEIAAGRTSTFSGLFCDSMDRHAKMSARYPNDKIYLRMSRMYYPDTLDPVCSSATDEISLNSVRMKQ